jgi:CubicO group peptidase (beta-lactamase class C family)
MPVRKFSILFILSLFLFSASCDKNPEPGKAELYFPPVSGTWESITPETAGWNTSQLEALYKFLEDNNSRAFIVLKDGKIVIEKYWGQTLTGNTFTASGNWYWASAGKTLTSFLVGKAQEEGFLSIDQPSGKYQGTGWTSLTASQELAITVKHQLTMTSGLNDAGDHHCTDKSCLTYLKNPGERWAYHNGPYTLLDKVISGATQMTFDSWFETRLKNKIGMDGLWTYSGYDHVYYSTPRSMARFGLLILAKGVWDGETILGDQAYIQAMTSTSNQLNQSYGYLWWLNGKSSYMIPTLQTVFSGELAPDAPDDMIAAMGKNGQLINIVPSKNIVVIRMGDNPDNSEVSVLFQNQIWQKLSAVIN